MKKKLFLILSVLSFGIAQSQEISDAVRFSQENLNGTARFRAMSGAFGALGGDLSSINVNPAGSAIFANNQMAITASNTNTKNNSTYFGSTNTEKNNSFDFNQAGLVFVFNNNNRNNEGWKKFSLAINYDNKNNFDNTIGSFGINPTNSIGNYFLSYANGIPLNSFKDSYYENLSHASQQAFLGYNAFIIDPANADPNTNSYISNIAEGGNYYQENTVSTNGYNGKLSFNAAASCNDKFFIGINLNSHFVDYTQSSVFYEDNDNTLEPTSYRVNKVQFNNNLYTYGSGFSFQLGIIGKITNEARVGLSYESPTWYKLNDELTQTLVAVSANSTTGPLDPDVVDPNVTNVYAPYKLQTPGKLTGSFAYVFGKTGLISIDYSRKNYGNIRFKPEYDSYYQGVNNEIDKTLSRTNEVRIGGEYKIERLSLRAGYRFEQSPYKNKTTIGDLNGYSGGLGYNFGSTRADLSYAYAERNSQQAFFSQGLTDRANINSITNTVSLTLLFEL
ncbi:OmpP1/FadL family transporter [Flavobacterium undicola]|uniref:OmpP1/FadL family transporter n=1 Tax=Flavobacterium undicola TaxID=1932779 RepID=UPI0013785BA7|nr:outer membrane protein transport protein [Flavobacterium undicola]MBA0884041.1 outer membrane protein transport protein [Flavobacterium undicola]